MATKMKSEIRKLENNQIFNKKSRGGRNYVRLGAGHGGARNGSGRKEGAAKRRTREIVDKLFADGGITPLSHMLSVMRETPDDVEKQYKSGAIDFIEYTVKMQGLTERRDRAAVSALRYMHPKLSAVTATGDLSGHDQFVKDRENGKL